MEKIRTATGKEFNSDYFNPSELTKQADIRIIGVSIVTAASVFSDKSETVQLWCGNAYASGFTSLLCIRAEGDAIRVVLGKE